MKIDNYRETLPLTGETIDKISEKVESLLIKLVNESTGCRNGCKYHLRLFLFCIESGYASDRACLAGR